MRTRLESLITGRLEQHLVLCLLGMQIRVGKLEIGVLRRHGSLNLVLFQSVDVLF